MRELCLFGGYDARLRRYIREHSLGHTTGQSLASESVDTRFNSLATELFALQYAQVPAYRQFCQNRGVSPAKLAHWSDIPPMPVAAFKELELTSLPSMERTTVFCSSGTTRQRSSRHFHNAQSLALYEASLLPWFQAHLLADVGEATHDACAEPAVLILAPQPPEGGTPNTAKSHPTPFEVPTSAGSCGDHDLNENICAESQNKFRFVFLTPSSDQAPRSSLAHMFETVRRHFGPSEVVFAGDVTQDGDWTLNAGAVLNALNASGFANQPVVLLGTAFSFVHLLDHMERKGVRCSLPQGSRILETGGYKGRSREIPKWELHALLSDRLGVPSANIIGEYGMCELSSQAYDGKVGDGNSERVFRFPPWARVRLISPETGQEVSEGDTGLIQVFDLANMRSVMAIQTEDLGIRRRAGFELVGRAVQAEPRGCSLMAV